jgi:hypothetical protein
MYVDVNWLELKRLIGNVNASNLYRMHIYEMNVII